MRERDGPVSRTEHRPRPGPAERRWPQLCAETARCSCFSSECSSRSVVSSSLLPSGLQPARPLCPSDSPGKSTAVGCHALHPGIEPRFPSLQAVSLPGEPPGKPCSTPLSTTQPKIVPPSRSRRERLLLSPWGLYQCQPNVFLFRLA